MSGWIHHAGWPLSPDGDFWDPARQPWSMMKQIFGYIFGYDLLMGIFLGSFRNDMSAVLLADAFATSWDVKKCMSSMAKKQVL